MHGPSLHCGETLNAAQGTTHGGQGAAPRKSAVAVNPWAAQRRPLPSRTQAIHMHSLRLAPMVQAVHSGYIHGRRGAMAPVLLPRRHEPRPRSRPPRIAWRGSLLPPAGHGGKD